MCAMQSPELLIVHRRRDVVSVGARVKATLASQFSSENGRRNSNAGTSAWETSAAIR